MECCFCSTSIPLLGSLLILVTIAARERPPNTPLGRALYLSIAINALALVFTLFCQWFPPWNLTGSYPYSTLLETMWNDNFVATLILLGLGYLAFGAAARAILGRPYRDEDVDE